MRSQLPVVFAALLSASVHGQTCPTGMAALNWADEQLAPTAGSQLGIAVTLGDSSYGDVTYEWDLDGDGVVDRRGQFSTLQLSYVSR